MKRLFAEHLAGNALLLWLGYYWLGIGESRASALLWSGFIVLALLALACWLHGVSLTCFRGLGHRPASRHLFPLIVAALVTITLYALIGRWAAAMSGPALKIASWLTLTFRKPVKPATVAAVFSAIFWIIRWVLLPVLLLPLASGIAARGWYGIGEFGRLRSQWLYWIETPVLLLCALWLPLRLLGWAPGAGSFTMQMVSFVLRAVVSYLLFVAALLLLAFFTSSGKPPLSQLKTAPSP